MMAIGNLDKVHLPNGITSDYDYDAMDRLDLLTHLKPDGTKLATFKYTLRADGKRTQEVKGTDFVLGEATKTLTFNWTYDAVGRLKTETIDDSAADSLGRTTTWAYDLTGNRVEQIIDMGSDGALTADETISYSYNNLDQLTVETSDTNSDGTPEQTTTYTYTGTQQTGKLVENDSTGTDLSS